MTELVTDSARLLQSLDFKARCESHWEGEPEQCGRPATLLVTFRNVSEVVVMRLACEPCRVELEEQGRVYEVRKI